jgi:hypothetical protein
MAPKIPTGWKRHTTYVAGAETTEYSAVFPNKRIARFDEQGNLTGYTTRDVRVVTDVKTGEMQLYETFRGGLPTGDKLVATFSPATGEWAPNSDNQAVFEGLFTDKNTRYNGSEQLRTITKDSKARTVEIAEAVAADPNNIQGLTSEDVQTLKNKPGFTSTNNIATKDPVSEAALRADREAKEAAKEGRGSTDTEEDSEPDVVGSQVESLTALQRPASSYEQKLTYPVDLAESYQDYLKIQMVEYKPRGFASGEDSFTLPSRPNIGEGGQVPEGRNILSSIFLPIPGGIGDNNVASWSKGDMDPIQGQIANLSYQAMAGDGQGIRETVGQMTDKVQNNTAGLKALVTQSIIKELTGVDVLRRQQGAVINQNSELLFDGPGLRSFTFTYKFSPRGGAEAQTVKKIIRTLKQGMSAKKANNFLFIKSPHTFFLSYQHQNKIHPFLNKFKECALTSLGVNYTPDGNYATYYDGSMVSYQVTMTFQEIEPIFDDDYGNDYNNIGF